MRLTGNAPARRECSNSWRIGRTSYTGLRSDNLQCRLRRVVEAEADSGELVDSVVVVVASPSMIVRRFG